MSKSPARDALIARMLSFDGHFDGYPSMSCSDEALIDAAYFEQYPTHDKHGLSSLAFIAYLASEHVTTKEQYLKALAFYRAWIDATWECNMCEGSNPAHAELTE